MTPPGCPVCQCHMDAVCDSPFRPLHWCRQCGTVAGATPTGKAMVPELAREVQGFLPLVIDGLAVAGG